MSSEVTLDNSGQMPRGHMSRRRLLGAVAALGAAGAAATVGIRAHNEQPAAGAREFVSPNYPYKMALPQGWAVEPAPTDGGKKIDTFSGDAGDDGKPQITLTVSAETVGNWMTLDAYTQNTIDGVAKYMGPENPPTTIATMRQRLKNKKNVVDMESPVVKPFFSLADMKIDGNNTQFISYTPKFIGGSKSKSVVVGIFLHEENGNKKAYQIGATYPGDLMPEGDIIYTDILKSFKLLK